jgi:MFS family permease
MIAVALVTVAHSYSVSIPQVTWLVSGFYLAAAVGQPLMGRLADLFGPRRIFLIGLLLVLGAGILGPFAPGLGFLVAVRVLQAFGTSTAYPSGLAIIRRESGNPSSPPASALGLLSIAANVSAGLGPTIGGAIIAFANWQGIFAVNIPLAIVGLILGLRFLPPDPLRSAHEGSKKEGRRAPIDFAGLLLFAGALASLLVFLLSLSGQIRWPFLPVSLLLGAAFVVWEGRAKKPFIDLPLIVSTKGLGRLYLTFATMNTVFYSLFFGLPLWLQQARGLSPSLVGLVMLPFAGLGVVATPVAARLIRTRGVRFVLVIGMTTLAVGTLLLLLLRDHTSIGVIIAITVLLGIPNAFNNLGLQAALFQTAPAKMIGAASGLFQTFRYVGTFLSSALLGIVFGSEATSSGLHLLAGILAAISLVLFVVSLEMAPLRAPG